MTDDSPLVAISFRPQAQIVNGETVLSSVGNFVKVIDCLRAAGLTPVLANTQTDLSRVSAVVIPGGGDISPTLYGGTTSDGIYDVSNEQDAIDLALVAHATAEDLPLLGICRGAQLINVARGGSLYEELPPGSGEHHNNIATSSYPNVFVSHDVQIEMESLTASAYPDYAQQPETHFSIPVRSAHHQCVRELGTGLRVVGRAADGTIEAFESATGWTLGVQWHPEAELVEGPLKQGLFSALAKAVIQRRTNSSTQQQGGGRNLRPSSPDLVSYTRRKD